MWKLSFRSRSCGGVDVCRNEIMVVEEFYVKKDGGMSQVVVCIGKYDGGYVLVHYVVSEVVW